MEKFADYSNIGVTQRIMAGVTQVSKSDSERYQDHEKVSIAYEAKGFTMLPPRFIINRSLMMYRRRLSPLRAHHKHGDDEQILRRNRHQGEQQSFQEYCPTK